MGRGQQSRAPKDVDSENLHRVVPRVLVERLRQKAAAEERTISSVVRLACTRYLDDEDQDDRAAARRAFARYLQEEQGKRAAFAS